MDCPLHLIIHRSTYTYGNLIFTPNIVTQYQKDNVNNGKNFNKSSLPEFRKIFPLRLNQKGLNAYLVSAYITTLKRSNLYRNSAIRTLIKFSAKKVPYNENWVLLIKLRNPRKQFLDYAWSV